MKSLNDKRRLEELMQKYLAREQSPAEAEELFDMLQSVQKATTLEEIFENRWDIEIRPEVDMLWQDVLAARERAESANSNGKVKSSIRTLWKWSMAASVLFAIAFVWWNQQEQSDFVTYSTGFGETQEIHLEDGTEIILNANSELRWNKKWKSNNIRNAELQGEAFFEVAHVNISSHQPSPNETQSERMPFHVRSGDMVIEVLGTAFNVEERRGEARVYLKEGAVKLYFSVKEEPSQRKTREKSTPDSETASKSILMSAGETVQYSARTREWVRVEEDLATSITEWKDGILMFDEISFGNVLQRMEDIYGKTFEVEDPKLLDRQVNFEVPYESWETIEKLMSVTLNLEFETSGKGRIFIKNRKE